LLAADPVQRACAAGSVVQAGAHEPDPAVHRSDVHQLRDVVRALRDHRDQPAPRLLALVVGDVLPDDLGLVDVPGHHRSVLRADVPVPGFPAGDLDLRDARAGAGQRWEGARMKVRTPLYGLMAEFDAPGPLLEAVKKAREAGYRDMNAYS